jgi:hypothetical protein
VVGAFVVAAAVVGVTAAAVKSAVRNDLAIVVATL